MEKDIVDEAREQLLKAVKEYQDTHETNKVIWHRSDERFSPAYVPKHASYKPALSDATQEVLTEGKETKNLYTQNWLNVGALNTGE